MKRVSNSIREAPENGEPYSILYVPLERIEALDEIGCILAARHGMSSQLAV
jgi:hypothetical protein